MAQVMGENAFTTLNGWFKEVYASEDMKLVPNAAWLVKNLSFSKSDAGLGNLYHQPLVLTHEHGVTYAGSGSGAFAIETPIAQVVQDAQVQGTQMLIASRIDYEAASRAAVSKASFGDATELLVKNMMESISKRLELMFLYGRSGIGEATSSGATTSLVISAASWASGIWAGLEGAKLEVVNSTGTTSRTTGTGVTVVSLVPSTRTITVTPALGAGHAATDLVYFFSSMVAGPTYRESLGLDQMCVGTGTIFNIATGTYQLYKGNSYAVSGALTVTKVLDGLLPAIGKGLMDDVVLLCSNKAFQGLLNPTIDPVAISTSNSKVGAVVNQNRADKMVFGADNIQIRGYQGVIDIVPHLFVKDGEAFAFPKKMLKRVGSTDITFNTPGSKGGEFFLQLPSNAGYELRAYLNQALFSPSLGRLTKYTGIT